MDRLKRTNNYGFTVIELVVVMAVIAILAGLTFNAIGNAQAKARDNQRAGDLSTLHSRLEEYYNDYGGYPNSFTAANFPGIDPAALVDPSGVSITIATPVSDQVAALATTNPTSAASYMYIPYPTGCTSITCTGYVLKSYIEKPDASMPNPYLSFGLNNN